MDKRKFRVDGSVRVSMFCAHSPSLATGSLEYGASPSFSAARNLPEELDWGRNTDKLLYGLVNAYLNTYISSSDREVLNLKAVSAVSSRSLMPAEFPASRYCACSVLTHVVVLGMRVSMSSSIIRKFIEDSTTFFCTVAKAPWRATLWRSTMLGCSSGAKEKNLPHSASRRLRRRDTDRYQAVRCYFF